MNNIKKEIMNELEVIDKAIRMKDGKDYNVFISDIKRIFNDIETKKKFNYFDLKWITGVLKENAIATKESMIRAEKENYSRESMPKDNELYVSYSYIIESCIPNYLEREYDVKI
jgi:hypothetical protein